MTRQVDFVFLYVSMFQHIVWLIIRAVRSLYLNVVNVPGFRVVILDYSPYAIYYITPALGRIFKEVQNWMTIAESSNMELSVHRVQVLSWIPL